MPRRCEVESIDLLALQRRASEAERQRLADRMFAVWRPLFDHLADKDASFHRKAHVEDRTASYLRAHFYRIAGRDRGLVIARVHVHHVGGRPFSRISLNAGAHAELRGSNVVGPPLARAMLWALAHAPRPIFLIDLVGSATAWRSIQKPFPELRPSPHGDIPAAWWPYALAGAEALRCSPVDGRPRGVVRSHVLVAEGALEPGRPTSKEAVRAAAWYRGLVRDGESMLVVVPMKPARMVAQLARWALRRGRAAVLGVPA